MDHFEYRQGSLYCENTAIHGIAGEIGTPLYIYSAATILHHIKQLRDAFQPLNPLICYATKANSTLAVLKLIHDQGCGFDVVSRGELARVRKVGADPRKVVFAGVGKTDEEIAEALKARILLFNVESPDELEHISAIAKETGATAGVALRVNPDVDPDTHKYITTGRSENKFGIDVIQAAQLAERWKHHKAIRIQGIHCHIGSQITKVQPYKDALTRILPLLHQLRDMGHPIEYIDCGGGFGINYTASEARRVDEFAREMIPVIRASGYKMLLEPGRFIVGNAGILVIKVLYLKPSGLKCFAITDGGMNDLIRPSLYQAYHKIWLVETGDRTFSPSTTAAMPDGLQSNMLHPILTDVVGPVCESGDFLAKDRYLPKLKRGDLLAVFSAGAYGFTMSSNYNSRPRPAEILVQGDRHRVIRERERFEHLIAGETLPA